MTVASRGRRRLAAVLCALLAAAPAGAREPDAATVLRRADLVRNPVLGTAIDLELTVVSKTSGRELRRSRFVLLTRRGERTLLLMPGEDGGPPGAALIDADAYWLLLPRASRPVRLALERVVAGDLSHAGFLRLGLWSRYRARFDGEETLDGVPCRRLELEPAADPAPFGRVRYWVAANGLRPIRIEFYSATGELLKTARFVRYRDTGSGPRPSRIEIEDAGRPDEQATLDLGPPRGVPTSRLAFDLDDLAALREAAIRLAAEDGRPASGPDLVDALAESARRREEDERRLPRSADPAAKTLVP